jgi:hypothetical protein
MRQVQFYTHFYVFLPCANYARFLFVTLILPSFYIALTYTTRLRNQNMILTYHETKKPHTRPKTFTILRDQTESSAGCATNPTSFIIITRASYHLLLNLCILCEPAFWHLVIAQRYTYRRLAQYHRAVPNWCMMSYSSKGPRSLFIRLFKLLVY